jgi:histidinol-phosphate/aromatic aminotransferase/cobyric acid decarboxylase-like protein
MGKGLSAIKPQVLKAAAYTLRHFEAKIKINQNENPYEMPFPIKAAVEKVMVRRLWSRYPPFSPEELAKRLAAFSGWQSDGILVGNGSNELIQALLLVTVEKAKRVVFPQPTFTLYKLMTSILGGECDEVYLTADLRFDVAKLLMAVQGAD